MKPTLRNFQRAHEFYGVSFTFKRRGVDGDIMVGVSDTPLGVVITRD